MCQRYDRKVSIDMIRPYTVSKAPDWKKKYTENKLWGQLVKEN